MVLVMVVHTLEAVTATVPMCVILLNDLIKRKELPEGLRLRQVVPTTGAVSTSLWDVTDLAFFEEWLTETLGPGVEHSILQVSEEFSFGLMGHVNQARTADKAKQQFAAFSSTTKNAMSRAGNQLTDFDKKYEISERTSNTFKRMSDAASQAKGRAMQNPTIAKVSTNVSSGVQAGLKSVGKGFGWARENLKASLTGNQTGAPVQQPPQMPSNQQNPRADTQAATQQTPEAVFDLADEDDRAI